MRIGQKRYRVDRMSGWYQVEFREVGTRRRRIFNLDELVQMAAAKKAARAGSRKRMPVRKRRVVKRKE
jgi:hypothetical protein